MTKDETKEDKEERLQKEMTEREDKLTEAPEDRMIDPKKRGNRSGVVTR